MIRKTIPTLLIAACLPAFAFAAPPSPQTMPCGGPAGFGHGFGPGPGFGGPGPKGEMGPRGGMAGIKLTPEQRDNMRKIMGDQAKANNDIQQKYFNKLSDADKKAMLDELNKSRDDSRKKMRAVLTTEQQKIFDERQKRQEDRMKEWKEFQDWKASKASQK